MSEEEEEYDAYGVYIGDLDKKPGNEIPLSDHIVVQTKTVDDIMKKSEPFKIMAVPNENYETLMSLTTRRNAPLNCFMDRKGVVYIDECKIYPYSGEEIIAK